MKLNCFLYKRIGLVLILINFLFPSFAQTYQWAQQGVSQGFDYGNGMTSDDSGNVYVTGQIEYSAVFGSNTLVSGGKHDILFAKYSPSGNLQWARRAGGTGGDVGWGIVVDGARNSYQVGEFETRAGFDAGDSLDSFGGNDIFLAKYDGNGNYVDAMQFGGSGDDKGRAIAIDPAGFLYFTGYFSGNADFGPLSLNSSSGSNDIFILKTNLSGTPVWVKKAGGTKEDRGRGIAYDTTSGSIYLTGTFTQSATFGATTITSTGKYSTYLAKYNSSGTVQWVRKSGGCCDTTRANAVTYDDAGNIYITGYFRDTATFGAFQLISGGSTDVFVVKYDPNGNVIWARGEGGPYEDMGYSLRYDPRQELLYVTGQIDDHGYFDSVYIGAAGNRDVFLAAYDTSGHIRWLKSGGGVFRDAGQALTFDSLGAVYITGFFTTSANFGTTALTGNLLADFFVTKLSPAPASQPTVAASGLTTQRANCNDILLNWTNGDGTRRTVVAKANSPVSVLPPDGNSYTASSAFGSGADLGSGNFVVYDGTGTTVQVTGLSLGVRYYFVVIECNGTGMTSNYYTTGYPQANAFANSYSMTSTATPTAVCAGASSSLHASGALTYQWSPASGLSATTGSTVTANPTTTTTYTVTGTDGSGCQALTQVTLTINASPVVTFGSLPAICSGAAAVTLTGGSPSGGTYSGTGVSGNTFNPAVSGVGSFTLTYSYTNGNGCSASATSVMHVNALPTVTLGTFNPICSNASSFTLSGGSPASGIYSGAGISGGNFNPASAGSGSHAITYTYTDGNGCVNTANSSILVNQAPTVSLGSLAAVCSNASSFALGGGSPAGGTYNGNGVSGGNFNPAVAGTGVTTITYAYTDANSCSASASATITVRALPVVTLASFASPCSNTASISLNGGSPSGGVYSGTTVSTGHFYPATAGPGTYTITYTYTDANSCVNSAQSSITVLTAPTVTLSAPSSVCINDGPVTLTGGSPTGGTYFGTGVSGGMFDPGIGAGSYAITYSYTNAQGCSGNASSTINVRPAPVLNLGQDVHTCANQAVTLSSGSVFTSYSWSTGATTQTISVDSSGVGIGTKSISLIVMNAFGCSGRDTILVTFLPVPSVTQSALPAVCVNDGLLNLSGGSPSGGTYFGTGVSNGMFDPAIGVGSYTITYSYTNVQGCSGNASTSLNVRPSPVVNLGPDTLTCANSTITLSPGAVFSAYSWSTGASTQTITMDSTGTGLGTRTVSLSVMNSFGCSNRDTILVTFDLCSGLDIPFETDLGVTIFPNPFTGSIQLLCEKKITFSIFDATGKLVEHRENVTGPIHTCEDLAPGTFYIDVLNHLEGRKIFTVVKTAK